MCKFYRNFLGTISMCLILLCISGCGKKGTVAVAKNEISPRKECANWCKSHKMKTGFDSSTKRTVFVISDRISANFEPIEIEQKNKKIRLPGNENTIRATLKALTELAELASYMKGEMLKETKNGNENILTTTASISFGDLTFEIITIAKQTTVEKEDKISVSHNVSKSISLREKNRVLLRQKFNEDGDKLEYSDSIKTFQDFDVLTKKNGLRMTIPYAAFNKKTAAFVFVFLPIQSIDTTTNGEK